MLSPQTNRLITNLSNTFDQCSLLSILEKVISIKVNKEEFILDYLRQCHELKDTATIRHKYLYVLCVLFSKTYSLKQIVEYKNLDEKQKDDISEIENAPDSPLKDKTKGNQVDRYEIDTKLYELMKKGEEHQKYVISVYQDLGRIHKMVAILNSNTCEHKHQEVRAELDEVLNPKHLSMRETNLAKKLFNDLTSTKYNPELEAQQQEIDVLKSSLLQKEREIKDLKQKLECNAAAANTGEHKKKVDKQEKDLASLKEQLKDYNNRIKKLNSRKRSPKKHAYNKQDIEKRLQLRNNQANELKTNIEQLEQELKNEKLANEKALKNSNEERIKLQKQLDQAIEQNQSLRADIKLKKSELANFITALEQQPGANRLAESPKEILKQKESELVSSKEENKKSKPIFKDLKRLEKSRKHPVLFYGTIVLATLSFIGSFGLIGYLKLNFIRFFKNFVYDISHRIYLALILSSVFFTISALCFSGSRDIKNEHNRVIESGTPGTINREEGNINSYRIN